jgi:hypothetical protein
LGSRGGFRLHECRSAMSLLSDRCSERHRRPSSPRADQANSAHPRATIATRQALRGSVVFRSRVRSLSGRPRTRSGYARPDDRPTGPSVGRRHTPAFAGAGSTSPWLGAVTFLAWRLSNTMDTSFCLEAPRRRAAQRPTRDF